MVRMLAGAFLLLSSAGWPSSAQDEAACLVPTDATILVRFQSVSALLDLAHAFGSLGGQLGGLDAAAFLGGLQVPGDPSVVDVSRPFFLAFTHAAGSPEPAMTWIAPVSDAAKFQAPLADAGVTSAVLGGYVGVSQLPAYAASAAPSPLLARLRPGVVSAHVDLERLLALFRPLLDLLLVQAENALDSLPDDEQLPFDAQPMYELYFEGARSVLDSAQALGLTLERQGEELAFLVDLAARPGSALDGWESGERADLEALSGYVDPGAPGQMLMAIDWPAFYRHFSGVMDAAVAVYPEPFRAELQRLIEAQEEIMGLLQPGMAASFDFASDGIQGVYALRSARSAEVVAGFAELAASFQREEGWIRLQEPGTLAVGGLEARTWKIAFDWESLLGSTTTAGESPQEQAAALRQMFDALYGEDLRIGLARKDGLVLVAFGNGEEFLRPSLARALSPAAPGARIRALLARTGGGTPSLAYHVDFGRLMARMMGAMSSLQAMFPGPAFPWPEAPFAVDSWGAIRGSTWSGGMAVSLRELLGFVQAVQGLETSPK